MRELELTLAKDWLATLRAGDLALLEEKLKVNVDFTEKAVAKAKAAVKLQQEKNGE